LVDAEVIAINIAVYHSSYMYHEQI